MAQQQTMQRKKSCAGGAAARRAPAARPPGRSLLAGGRRGEETGGRVGGRCMENALASFEGRRRISLSVPQPQARARRGIAGRARAGDARRSDPPSAPNAYTSPRAEPKGREGRGSCSAARTTRSRRSEL